MAGASGGEEAWLGESSLAGASGGEEAPASLDVQARNATAKTPLVVATTPLTVAKTPLTVAMTPLAEAKIPLAVAKTPLTVATTPLMVATTPLAVAKTPLAVAKTPLAVAKTPLAEATTPLTVATTPLTVATTPLAEAKTPLMVATTPMAVAKTPLTVATTPLAEATTSLTVATTPLTVATTPLAEAKTPLMVATTPMTVVTTPLAETKTPLMVATTPMTVATTPLAVAKTPLAAAKTPLAAAKTPLRVAKTPLAAATIPLSVDLEARNGTAKTPLAVAVDRGSLHAAHCLLSHGADVFTVDFYGRSILHFLSERDVTFDLLLRDVVRQGVDVRATDKGGNSPLHVAAYMGNVSKVRVLLSAGASPDQRNLAGKTPLFLALQRRDPAARETILLFLLTSVLLRVRDRVEREPLLLQGEDNAVSRRELHRLQRTGNTLHRRCVVAVRRSVGLSRLVDIAELGALPCPVFLQRAIFGEDERSVVDDLNL